MPLASLNLGVFACSSDFSKATQRVTPFSDYFRLAGLESLDQCLAAEPCLETDCSIGSYRACPLRIEAKIAFC